MTEKKKIMINTEEVEFGVFTYDEDDNNISELNFYCNDRNEAVSEALSICKIISEKHYVEVWEKDEDGLWGNCGEPVWKSDV